MLPVVGILDVDGDVRVRGRAGEECRGATEVGFWATELNGACCDGTPEHECVGGSPWITDPRGSITPPLPLPRMIHGSRITDHLPHKPPSPLPSKMIRDFPDHPFGHVDSPGD